MCSCNALNTRSRHTTTWLQVLLRAYPPIIRMHLDGFLELVAPACFPWKCAWIVPHILRLPPSPFFLHCVSIPTNCTDLDGWCETGNVLPSLSLLSLFSSPTLCAFVLVSRPVINPGGHPAQVPHLLWCPGTVTKPGVSCMDLRIIQLRW